MDVKAVCKGQRRMEMTRGIKLFLKQMSEGSPGRGRNAQRQGKEHAGPGVGRSGQATRWTVDVHFGSVFTICTTRGWDLCCGSPDPASLMMDKQMSLLGHEASYRTAVGSCSC